MAIDNTEAIEAKNSLKALTDNLERQVRTRTDELDAINRELTRTLDLKARFVADASHELRTPMTVIQGNIELAMMEAEGEGKREHPELYRVILDEIARMQSVLSDLTMLTNSEHGAGELRRETLDLTAVVRAVERSLRVVARKKNISLTVQARRVVTITGDRDKLQKLISNIVCNAVKYTSQGGTVTITVSDTTSGATVAVADTGIGIARKDLTRIFERFYRVDSVRASGTGGSGLGLAIANAIARVHDGSIEAKSKLGVGSTFTVHLPRK